VNGYAEDLEYIQRRIQGISQNMIVVVPTCNQGSTHSGIEEGAKKYFYWIKKYYTTDIKEISIIGHSLGGLYARFLVGLLYQHNFIPQILKPKVFISLSTPHLPLRFYDRFVHPKVSRILANALIGKSGAEMLMVDASSKSRSLADRIKGIEKQQSSLIPMMVRLCEDEFIIGLQCFEKLICYANIRHDPVVNYGNACLSPFDYCNKQANQEFKDVDLPHIFHHDVDINSVSEVDSSTSLGDDEDLLFRLGNLPWNRYGIIPSRPIVAHADMVNKFK
jgi:hypothetical protein